MVYSTDALIYLTESYKIKIWCHLMKYQSLASETRQWFFFSWRGGLTIPGCGCPLHYCSQWELIQNLIYSAVLPGYTLIWKSNIQQVDTGKNLYLRKFHILNLHEWYWHIKNKIMDIIFFFFLFFLTCQLSACDLILFSCYKNKSWPWHVRRKT